MATASAIRCGKNALLLEKNAKLGVKILMSGGTRCNITHDCDRQEIVKAFGTNGKFLHSSLASLPPDQVVQLIESAGVATKVESGGKIFPVSDKAIDVRDALVELATDPRAPGRSTLLHSTACTNISRRDEHFVVETETQTFLAQSVLITTGGKSYPGCGTTGDGYQWAQSFGHKIIKPVPALTPITNHDCWTHGLKGLSFENVNLKILGNGSEKALDQKAGAFLFTHFGYSGPSSLDISRTVSIFDSPEDLILVCDFEPKLNFDELRHELASTLQSRSKQNLISVLSTRYPRRFCELFLRAVNIDAQKKAAELGKANLNLLTENLKRSQFPIQGVFGFKKAEVTAGGVELSEIDSRTMESKICPGLFFAGEVMDLDGRIGGYNFQAAFSTGWLAGQFSRPS